MKTIRDIDEMVTWLYRRGTSLSFEMSEPIGDQIAASWHAQIWLRKSHKKVELNDWTLWDAMSSLVSKVAEATGEPTP